MAGIRSMLKSILHENTISDQFIRDKAEDQGLQIHRIKHHGQEILIRLELPGDENAIRRFKTQLRIKNPNIDRIEVRQPLGYVKEPELDLKPEADAYQRWRKSMIKQLYIIANKFGWEFFTNPKASVNTEYFFMNKGVGKDKKVLKIRLSDHPSWEEDTDVSIDMTKKEANLDDLKTIIRSKMKSIV